MEPFVSNTDNEVNRCHRSVNAYYKYIPAASRKHGACSGAILAHISERLGGPGQWNEGPQLDVIAPLNDPSEETTLVTLTVGGNDAGFAAALESCIDGAATWLGGLWKGIDHCKANAESLVRRGIWLIEHGGKIKTKVEPDKDGIKYDGLRWYFCEGANPGWNGESESMTPCGNIRGRDYGGFSVASLAGMLGKVRDRAPNAQILVLLYPHLFPEDPPAKCIVGQYRAKAGNTQSLVIHDVVADRLNQLTDDFDAALMRQVNVARSLGINVKYVETRDSFRGHSLACIEDPNATADPWIHRLLLDSGPNLLNLASSPYSFHPNATGQERLAELVNGAR